MTKPAKTFKDLVVWQKAHRFVLATYLLTASFPKSEIYCLTSQMRRAAISIPANIVEGRRQESEKEFARFLRIAVNSGCELEYHLIVARDIGAISEAESASLLRELIEVRKMIHGLLRKITNSPRPREMPV